MTSAIIGVQSNIVNRISRLFLSNFELFSHMKYLRLGIPGSWLDDDARSELERVAREVLPFAIRQDHPRCFAFIPSAPTWPGVLAERPGTT